MVREARAGTLQGDVMSLGKTGGHAGTFQGDVMRPSKERPGAPAPLASNALPGLPGRLAVAARASRFASSDSSTATCRPTRHNRAGQGYNVS